MNDDKKTSKGCHIPARYRSKEEHKKHNRSKIYQIYDLACLEGGDFWRGHRSRGIYHKLYTRKLRAKIKEDTMKQINEELNEEKS